MADAIAPTPAELTQIMEATGLSSKEFGEAIGYGDAERVTRALVRGARHQKPYSMSPTATRALRYMMGLADLAAAHAAYRADQTPENEERLLLALERASELLPARLRPKDLAT